MSLINIAENIFALDLGATLIGVLVGDTSITLIDSGMNDQHAKIIAKSVDKPISAVLHTHFHADHTGGTNYLVKKYNSKPFMPANEQSFGLTTELKPALLYGGLPPKIYRSSFLLPKPIPVEPVPSEPFQENSFNIAPINTAGHSIAHTSYLVNRVLFVGDAVSSPEVIGKHKILYMYNPALGSTALDRLAEIDFDKAVLCHKGVVDKNTLLEYIDIQRKHFLSVEQDILAVADSNSVEDITKTVLQKRDIEINPVSWLLVLSTIKGYLAKLENDGVLESEFIDISLRWKHI